MRGIEAEIQYQGWQPKGAHFLFFYFYFLCCFLAHEYSQPRGHPDEQALNPTPVVVVVLCTRGPGIWTFFTLFRELLYISFLSQWYSLFSRLHTMYATLAMIGAFSMSKYLGIVEELNMNCIDIGRYHDARRDLHRSAVTRHQSWYLSPFLHPTCLRSSDIILWCSNC